MNSPGKDNIEPLVSICCITYNHEQFISKAIDGFLMQKTTFPVEIIIGEDHSTDKTLEIIYGYINKYPGRIKLITTNHNVGAVENERRFQCRHITLPVDLTKRCHCFSFL